MVNSTEEVLRAAGLRVTRPRIAVLDVLVECPHATVDLVAQEVRGKLDAMVSNPMIMWAFAALFLLVLVGV